jgi:DNA (cytosine-5)-methyltransferase 1
VVGRVKDRESARCHAGCHSPASLCVVAVRATQATTKFTQGEGRTSGDVLVVDLFAGCGGLSAGFIRANEHGAQFRPVAAVEKDVAAAATYAANISKDIYVGDIQEWLRSAKLPEAGAVNIVLGGPPCQGFSALGKQDVLDLRNQLWQQYVESVVRLKPDFFVLENVREFLKSSEFKLLERETLSDGKLSGYAIEFFLLDCSQFGSPQRRKRAIIIGRRGDLPKLGMPAAVEGLSTVKTAFKGLPRSVVTTDLPRRFVMVDSGQVAGPYSTKELHFTRRFTELSRRRFESIPEGGNRFDLPDELKSPCWRAHKSGSGDVMGRMHWDQPSVTIRTEFFKPEKGRYIHPSEHRSITHAEAARLQGFPDDFQWFGSKSSIARQIGNAVPLELGHALARHILRSDAFKIAQAQTVTQAHEQVCRNRGEH